MGVEILRDAPKGGRRLRLLADAAPHPIVVYLSDEAIQRPDISELLDALERADAPLILCVDAPNLAVPAAAHAMPQRRIALLAIEQSAWVLAARDPRCVVVDSRTELDWAMRQGKISVWAPSKLVLDAVEGPKSEDGTEVTDPLALAHWLAEAFEAKRVIIFGEGDADCTGPDDYAADALPDLG